MRWFIKSSIPEEEVDFKALGLSSLDYRLLVNRGVTSREEIQTFFNPSLENIPAPFLMKNLIAASNRISAHIKKGSKIRIIGDYDVDGVMSTTIFVRGLTRLGAKVDYDIPHRIHDGYGLNVDLVEKAKEEGIDLLITCDNGIAAFGACQKAKDLGMDLIVTDHHDLVKEEGKDLLPQADCILNPKQEEDSYPFKNLCGAGVAFKLLSALYTLHGLEEYVGEDFLAYTALATVCDVMPLISENRVLVSLGLEEIRESGHLGLQALIAACDLFQEEVSGYHLGFVLGPTINSVGRLEDAKEAVQLFLTEDLDQAQSLAHHFRDLNRYRQDLTNQGLRDISLKLKEETSLPDILMVVQEDLHESIVGIIAGRIKEKTHRPVVVLTKTDQGLKGSGRSIEAYNMSQEFGKFRDLLSSFGGHPMACGLSVKEEAFPEFYQKILEASPLAKEDLEATYYLDAQVPIHMVTENLVEDLEKFAPFGNGNPRPLFGDLDLHIDHLQILGKKQNVLKFQVTKNGVFREAILFGGVHQFFQDLNAVYPKELVEDLYYNRKTPIRVDILYRPKINQFNNKRTVQLQLEAYRFKEV